MSKLNSKLYKSKMSEENKKSSENIDSLSLYSNQVQVWIFSVLFLYNQLIHFRLAHLEKI